MVWSTRWTSVGAGVARSALAFSLVLGALLWALELDRPPTRPQLTISSVDGVLVVLIEGAGGGRLAIGPGPERTGTVAALARALRPWDARLDLVLVAAAGDLPAAIDLARSKRVRAVALLPGTLARPGVALNELRAVAAKSNVAVHELAGDETLRVGKTAPLAIELVTGPGGETGMVVRGPEATLALSLNGGLPAAAPVVVFARWNGSSYETALRAAPSLLVAPSSASPVPPVPADRDARLVELADGDTVVLVLAPPGIRVRGQLPRPLAGREAR